MSHAAGDCSCELSYQKNLQRHRLWETDTVLSAGISDYKESMPPPPYKAYVCASGPTASRG